MHVIQKNGFTLPEMLVVLSIVGVMLCAGLPSFLSYLQHQQLVTATNAFLSALNLARSEAIQRNRRVDVAPRDGKSWENGWIVFINKTGDSNTQFDAGDQLIYSHDKLASGLTITTTLRDKSSPYIAYNGSGRTRSNSSDQMPQLGSWQFSLNGHGRLVRVGLLGRPRICNPAQETNCSLRTQSP